MIKFVGVHESRPCLGIGLTRRNCELLLEGRPIVIDLALQRIETASEQVLDFNTAKLMILAGDSEAGLRGEIGKIFVIDKGTPELPLDPEETNEL